MKLKTLLQESLGSFEEREITIEIGENSSSPGYVWIQGANGKSGMGFYLEEAKLIALVGMLKTAAKIAWDRDL